MNFHILAKKNFGPGVAYSEFTTVRAWWNEDLGSRQNFEVNK